MADKVPYSEIMTRMHGDINYIAEEAYRDGYDHCEKEMREKIEEAYKRGINDGSLDVKQRAEGAYQRGLEDGKAVNDKGCEGCMYQDNTIEHHPCGVCCNAYNNRWTAKQTDDEIKVGDEVAFHHDDGRPNTVVVVTYIGQDGFIDGMDGRGTQYAHKNPTKWTKTGRHFDISSILKEMQS